MRGGRGPEGRPEAGRDEDGGRRGGELEALKGELSRLDARLSADLRPRLEGAAQAAAELGEKVAGLRSALEQLPLLRREAQELVGKLTRRQVSEIKQLARNPPDCIRRTLSAAWLLLNADRFRGQSAVQFNEEKDWRRCQRMLGEDSFVSGILNYSPACLEVSPQIPQYVASTYLGMKLAGPGPAQEPAVPRCASQCRSGSSDAPAHGPAQGAAGAAGAPKPRAPSKGTRSQASLGAAGSKASLPKPPLEVASVSRASEPCGTLLLWMQRLMAESQERSRLLRELAPAEAELRAAEQDLRALEAEARRDEGALAVLRLRALEREHELRRLRGEGRPPSGRRLSATGQAPLSSRPRSGRPPSAGRPVSSRPRSGLRKRAVRRLDLPPVQPVTAGGAGSRSATPVSSARGTNPAVGHLRPSGLALTPLRAPRTPKVELDVTGRLKSVKDRLAQFRVRFDKNCSVIVEESQALEALGRIALVLEEHRGRLKLALEGHCDHGEDEGVDEARGNAVARWLVDRMGVAAGLLRVRGRRHAAPGGRCVVPRPLQELVPLYGPISPKLASSNGRVGLYFEEAKAELTPETTFILMEMAKWLEGEKGTAIIEGHCDKAEPPSLGMRRARAAADELVKLGVGPKRLQPESRMAESPLSTLHAAPNRRVELYLG
ncbi:unnamed protein product [Prorocentrum cordatum]|uniref:OmpA-like domain-containing protein n=1 Tax=Prorocentrum cordatum TaxID=2364126 RepID=A0ABN9U6U6_9DINO|nr:unnamed protein product [Polarella glacialis]